MLTGVGNEVEAGELVPLLLEVSLQTLLALLQLRVHYLACGTVCKIPKYDAQTMVGAREHMRRLEENSSTRPAKMADLTVETTLQREH